jgi:hypothetical protein
MEIAVAILIIIGVVIVAALVFAGWLIVAVVRGFGRMLGMGNNSARQASHVSGSSPHRVRCAHPKCRADNPETARFCRRCGKVIRLPQPQAAGARAPAVARRVAMW